MLRYEGRRRSKRVLWPTVSPVLHITRGFAIVCYMLTTHTMNENFFADIPLFSSQTPAISSLSLAITAYHQLTASYLLTGWPAYVCRGAFLHRDIPTFMYQRDRDVRTHLVAATSMTEFSDPFCTLTSYCFESDR